ncbi:MAG: hypothetical protein A2020_05005 [Lentisphaerae bacterium GWF2_45_14]|nr:MAG: hypothetical protein A2020_05005 [Lentisphaerae bacterium GWF2_45_14]
MATEKRIRFTLIELLVVISIIAILASMLLPALRNAREMGKTTVCVNNFKQVGMALYSYAGDSNSFLPITEVGNSGMTENGWGSTLMNTWAQKLAKAGAIKTYAIGESSILVCPSLFPFGKFYSHYYIYGYRYPATEHWRLGNEYNINPWYPKRSPTKTALAGDSGCKYTATSVFGQAYYYMPSCSSGAEPMNGFIHTRHQNKAAFIFADGHAETVGFKQFVPFTDPDSLLINHYYDQNGNWIEL